MIRSWNGKLMKQRMFALGTVAVLCAAMSGCAGDSAALQNQTDFSGLDMPDPAEFLFGTTKYSEFANVGSHDPTVFRDPASGLYYSYSTDNSVDPSKPGKGIQIRKSPDLIRWEYVGIALDEASIREAEDNGEGKAVTETFWAPDIDYVDGEYRLYYSATKAFGSRESRIFLAVADHPEGPFHNRGVVVSSWNGQGGYAGPNAIDPDAVYTPDGRHYLLYGSYFQGIFLKEIGEDGMPMNTDRGSDDYYGTCLAQKGGSLIDGPEGPAILYHDGYYYLFLSYGWLGDTYDIRVGRSREVTGPYLDYNGNNMADKVPGITTGMKLACSYRFEAELPGGEQPYVGPDWEWGGFRAPGHGVPFDDDGTCYFVHHIRDGAEAYHDASNGQSSFYHHYLMVRRMMFVDGWPVLSPEPYAGETDEAIPAELLPGRWETIAFTENNDQKMPEELRLTSSGKAVFGESEGTWSYLPDDNSLRVTWDGQELHGKVLKCWDLENSRATICFTGIRNGVAWWGKYPAAS